MYWLMWKWNYHKYESLYILIFEVVFKFKVIKKQHFLIVAVEITTIMIEAKSRFLSISSSLSHSSSPTQFFFHFPVWPSFNNSCILVTSSLFMKHIWYDRRRLHVL